MRRINLSKVSNSSFSHCPCSSPFELFDVLWLILKTENGNLLENAWHDIHVIFKQARKRD